MLLYYPVGQKFTQNRSTSYGFQEIHTFSFFAKIQDGRQKWQKMELFPLGTGYSCTTKWIKISLEIALSLTVFEIFSKVAKIEIFPGCTGYFCTTLWVKNSFKIAVSLTVSEIFSMFYVPLKSKMAAKSSEK